MIEIHLQGSNPIRAIAVILFLLAFGFSLAMLYDALWPDSRPRRMSEIMRSCSASLFCFGVLTGYWSHLRTAPNWRTPIFMLAAVLLVLGFTMSRRERRRL